MTEEAILRDRAVICEYSPGACGLYKACAGCEYCPGVGSLRGELSESQRREYAIDLEERSEARRQSARQDVEEIGQASEIAVLMARARLAYDCRIRRTQ